MTHSVYTSGGTKFEEALTERRPNARGDVFTIRLYVIMQEIIQLEGQEQASCLFADFIVLLEFEEAVVR